MKYLLRLSCVLLVSIASTSLSSLSIAQDSVAKKPAEVAADKGTRIFDGKTLQGWKGVEGNWRVEDGAITGENFKDKPIGNNTFLVYEKPVKDFELHCEFKIVGGNSGIQYRSKLIDADKYIVGGYQADIDSGDTYIGINYEERGRGILAERSQIVAIKKDGSKSVVGSSGDKAALAALVKSKEWNSYRVVAKGNTLQHYINGALMSEVQDYEDGKFTAEGILALQLHAGPPMIIQFKEIYLKELK